MPYRNNKTEYLLSMVDLTSGEGPALTYQKM